MVVRQAQPRRRRQGERFAFDREPGELAPLLCQPWRGAPARLRKIRARSATISLGCSQPPPGGPKCSPALTGA